MIFPTILSWVEQGHDQSRSQGYGRNVSALVSIAKGTGKSKVLSFGDATMLEADNVIYL